MKLVSFGASFFDVPKILEVLKGCDMIYTTNVMARDELYGIFSDEKVAFIPPGMFEVIAYMTSNTLREHPNCAVIGFSELHKMFVNLVKTGHSETIIARKEYLGWETRTRGVADSLWSWSRPQLPELGSIIGTVGKVPTAVRDFHASRGR